MATFAMFLRWVSACMLVYTVKAKVCILWPSVILRVIHWLFPLISMGTLSPFPRSSWGEWEVIAICCLHSNPYSLYIMCRSSSLVHNPHIRAKLAQLVLLIAGVGGDSRGRQPTVSLLPVLCYSVWFTCVSQYSDSQRQVFADHSVATLHLLPALMTIFIDIEFTGESMEFEDKFRTSTE